MSASTNWSALRESLAVEALRRTGRLRLQVHGESMLPTLWPGDVAEIEVRQLRHVLPGEIVFAFWQGRFYLHRLVALGPNGFLTRGDSMPGSDPLFPSEAFLGTLVGVTRASKTVPVTAYLRSRSRVVGLLCCYSGVVRRVAMKFHRRVTEPSDIPAQLFCPESDLRHSETL